MQGFLSLLLWRMEPQKSIYVFYMWKLNDAQIWWQLMGILADDFFYFRKSKVTSTNNSKNLRCIWSSWSDALPCKLRIWSSCFETLTWLDVNLVDLANIDLSPLSCIISSAHLRRLIIGNRHLSFDAASLVHICHIYRSVTQSSAEV